MPRSSIIIPVHNNWNYTRVCLKTLAATTAGSDIEVIVVDNASADATPAACPVLGKQLFHERFHYIRNEANANFAGASNQGARLAKGDCLIFLNNDTELLPGWHEPLLEDFRAYPDIGATGPVLLYPAQPIVGHTVQHLGIFFSSLMRAGHLYAGIPAASPLAGKRRFFQAITGACLCIPRQLFLQTGLFDENFRNGFEDLDLCARLVRQGFRQTINPLSRMIHHESLTPGRHEYDRENSALYLRQAAPMLKPDFDTLLAGDCLHAGLSPWLLKLPEYAQEKLDELAAAGAGMKPEELLELLVRNPYWQAGWTKYASESGSGRDLLAPFLFKLFKSPPEGLRLCGMAMARRDFSTARGLLDTLFPHCKSSRAYHESALAIMREKGGEDARLRRNLERWFKNFPRFGKEQLCPFLKKYWQLNTELKIPIGHKNTQSYQTWVEAFDKPARQIWLESFMADLPHDSACLPGFSILMPVYNPNQDFLREAVDSVLAQAYPHWELCMVDDASTAPGTRKLLEDLAARDSRIRIAFRQQNGHIAAATNTALEMAGKNWIALLDQDDLLTPDALAHMAAAIIKNPRGLLFYSDEDKIAENAANCFRPHFKSNWDPQLLLSQNYICHLGVYAADRLREIGGEKSGYPAAQDHDLVLRYTAGLPDAAIVHVPHVLYHWRSHESSTARDLGQKPEAMDSRLRAIQNWCADNAPGSRVSYLYGPFCRVHYPFREQKVALLCDMRAQPEAGFRDFVNNWAPQTPHAYKFIFLVAHGTKARLPAHVGSHECRGPTLAEDFNLAAAAADADVLGFVSPALWPASSAWLQEVLSHLQRPGVGAVGGAVIDARQMLLLHGGYLRDASGRLQRLFANTNAHFSRYYCWNTLARTVEAVDGLCLFTHKKYFEDPGGLDEGMADWMFQDYCLRLAQAGQRTVWVPYAQFFIESNAGHLRNPNAAFMARWQNTARAFNSNINIIGGNFSLNINAPD